MTGYKIDHKVVDGADPAQKELRDELFGISGIRGKYPQVFLTNKTDKTEFIGDFNAVQELIENNDTTIAELKKFKEVFEPAKLT